MPASMPSLLKIPVGERDGRLFRADEVPAGLACACQCPGCGAPLVARNLGKHRRPHFAHHKPFESSSCVETALHKLAKKILLDARELILPGFSKPPLIDQAGKEYPLDACHADPVTWTYQEASAEVRFEALEGRRPDIVLYGSQPHRPLLVEVRVTHPVDEVKAALVRKHDIAMIEIDLSEQVGVAFDHERFRNSVLSTPENRQWIHCPRREAQYRDLMALEQARIDSVNANLQKEQAAKAELLARLKPELDYAREASRPENRWRKLQMMAKRDQPAIRALYSRHFEDASPPPWLMDLDPDASAFNAHPLLWQLAIYEKFIAGQPDGTSIFVGTIIDWVRETYGCDERLFRLGMHRSYGVLNESWLPDPASAILALLARMRDIGLVSGGRGGEYTVLCSRRRSGQE